MKIICIHLCSETSTSLLGSVHDSKLIILLTLTLSRCIHCIAAQMSSVQSGDKGGKSNFFSLHYRNLQKKCTALRKQQRPHTELFAKWKRRRWISNTGNVCKYNATMRRVLATIVSVEKYYILWVCVCSLSYAGCNAHAPYCHLLPNRL